MTNTAMTTTFLYNKIKTVSKVVYYWLALLVFRFVVLSIFCAVFFTHIIQAKQCTYTRIVHSMHA